MNSIQDTPALPDEMGMGSYELAVATSRISIAWAHLLAMRWCIGQHGCSCASIVGVHYSHGECPNVEGGELV